MRLARVGFCMLVIGDWLGGHLAFAEGVGVNHTAFDDPPHGWPRVLDANTSGGSVRCGESDGRKDASQPGPGDGQDDCG